MAGGSNAAASLQGVADYLRGSSEFLEQVEEAKASITTLESRNTALQSSTADLQKQLDLKESARQALLVKLTSEEAQKVELLGKVAKAESDVKAKQDQLDASAREQVFSEKKLLDDAARTHSKAIDQVSQERDALQQQLNSASATNDSRAAELDELRNSKTNADSQLRSLQATVESDKQNRSNLLAMQQTLGKKVESLNTINQSLELTMKSKNEAIKNQTAEIASVKSDCAALQEKEKKLLGDLEIAKTKIAAAERDQVKLSKQVQGHQATIDERDSAIKKAKFAADVKQKHYDKHNKDVFQAEAKNKDLENQLKRALYDMDQEKNGRHQAQSELDVCKRELTRVELSLGMMQKEFDDMLRRLQDAKAENTKLTTRINPLDPRLQARQDKMVRERPDTGFGGPLWYQPCYPSESTRVEWPGFKRMAASKTKSGDIIELKSIAINKLSDKHYESGHEPDYGEDAKTLETDNEIAPTSVYGRRWVEPSVLKLPDVVGEVVEYNHAFCWLNLHGRTTIGKLAKIAHKENKRSKRLRGVPMEDSDEDSDSDDEESFEGRNAHVSTEGGLASPVTERSSQAPLGLPLTIRDHKPAFNDTTRKSLSAEEHKPHRPSVSTTSPINTISRGPAKRPREDSNDRVHHHKAVCRPCFVRRRVCDSYGECKSCSADGVECVYRRCPRGRKCPDVQCVNVHPDQWNGAAKGDWKLVDYIEDEGREGGSGLFKRFRKDSRRK